MTSVLYECKCGSAWPLERLYFCARCPNGASVLCPDVRCCSSEIDTYYCPVSLHNHVCSDASANQYKSDSHFGCPICEHTLHVVRSDGEAGTATLRCRHCRWSSASCGLAASKTKDLIEAAIAQEAVPVAERAVQRLATLAQDEAERRGNESGFSSAGGAYRSRSVFSAQGRRASSRQSIVGSAVPMPRERARQSRKKWRVPEMHADL